MDKLRRGGIGREKGFKGLFLEGLLGYQTSRPKNQLFSSVDSLP
jgi:hypothetical protein